MASASKLMKGGETNAENQNHTEDHNPEKESDHAQEDQEVSLRIPNQVVSRAASVRDTI